ncbi:MAG: RpiB/LacA/LacB family sugar-phosphate isomerase [Planctomycetes bacterium]|nr:RpiB/LacA/LacB family sugar-phosphate isomerase [Planctomycetota bacterium]NOG55642.1 RpiB/LacA/LacB family sugar-phosphate isomerase [Planctomycetota bacterium]
MKVIIGADRRGYAAMEHVLTSLQQAQHEVVSVVPPEEEEAGVPHASAVEYPEQAALVAGAVSRGEADRGILLSGSGIGMAITSNKFHGIRAVVGHDEWTAQISRSHHDTNVLCIPTDMIGLAFVRMIVERWMTTPFAGGRHERRIAMISRIEEGRSARKEDADEVDDDG